MPTPRSVEPQTLPRVLALVSAFALVVLFSASCAGGGSHDEGDLLIEFLHPVVSGLVVVSIAAGDIETFEVRDGPYFWGGILRVSDVAGVKAVAKSDFHNRYLSHRVRITIDGGVVDGVVLPPGTTLGSAEPSITPGTTADGRYEASILIFRSWGAEIGGVDLVEAAFNAWKRTH